MQEPMPVIPAAQEAGGVQIDQVQFWETNKHKAAKDMDGRFPNETRTASNQRRQDTTHS
jgi:hypothetical protein